MNIIKQIRHEHRLTQGDFGYLFGVTGSHISKIEKGISYPHDNLLESIADHFDLKLDELKNAIYNAPLKHEAASNNYRARYELCSKELETARKEIHELRKENEAMQHTLDTMKRTFVLQEHA